MLVEREPRLRRLRDRFKDWFPGRRYIMWSFAWWMGLMLIGLVLADNTEQDPITMEAVLLLGTTAWGAVVIFFIRTRENSDAKRSTAVLVAFAAPLLAVAVVPITPSRPLPSVQVVLDELRDSTNFAFTDPGATYHRSYFQMMADLWEADFLVRDLDELQILFEQNEVPLILNENPPSAGETQINWGPEATAKGCSWPFTTAAYASISKVRSTATSTHNSAISSLTPGVPEGSHAASQQRGPLTASTSDHQLIEQCVRGGGDFPDGPLEDLGVVARR